MQQPVIRTQRIELVDKDGNLTLTLDGTHGIRLWGKDGKLRGSFGLLTTDRPALLFLHGPVPRIDLRLDESGNPDVTMVGNRQLELAEMCIHAWDKEDAEKQQAIKRKPLRRQPTKKEA